MAFKSVEQIKEFLLPFANELGVELVDVECKDGGNKELTIFIETESGVDLDTLEKFHNAIDEPLDTFDPTFGVAYTLNVSSPGLDRPFKTNRDYERNLGLDIEIKLYAPMKGKKFYTGTLTYFDDNKLIVIIDGKETTFERSKISKVNCAIEEV